MIAIFCLSLGMSLIPNYLHGVQGVNDGVIGAFAALSAMGSIMLGVVVNRIGYFRHPLHGIALALAAVAAAFALVMTGRHLPAFAIAYILLGGFFGTWTLFESALGGIAPRQFHARAYAIAEILSGAGYALAPFLAGFLYEVDPRLPILAGFGLTVVLIILLMTILKAKLSQNLAGADGLQ